MLVGFSKNDLFNPYSLAHGFNISPSRPEPRNVSVPTIIKSKSHDFHIEVHKITHGIPVSLGKYIIEFPVLEAAKSFQITGKIHCDQLNEATNVDLPIKIKVG